MPGAPVGVTAAAAEAALDRLAPKGALGVAVSGGGDSISLLVMAADWAKARGREIQAATVDHGLRPESGAEAHAVSAISSDLGLGHTILTAPDLHAVRGNLPAAARDARYRLLAEWARGKGLGAVLLGHTMDDLAETLLMRLARGSGIEGLAAMAERRATLGMTWLRPLLQLRRADLRDVLKARAIPWLEDPTNEDPAYDRVKARQALEALAPLGIDVDTLATSARHIARQREVLERALASLAGRARRWGPLGEACLDPGALRQDARDTALRLVADTLMRLSGAPYRPRFEPLAEALDAILAGRGGGLTLAGCLIRPGRAEAMICREPAACAPPVSLGSDPVTWDGRWRVGVADAPQGASVGALGEDGLAALSKVEEWSQPTVWSAAPREVRRTTPAIWAADGTLLAAPLAGYAAKSVLGRALTTEIALNLELL